MNLRLRHAAAWALATSVLSAAHAADHLITFEEPGLIAMGNAPGSLVPVGAQLHDQFLNLGVSFSSGSAYIAVVDHGCCTASVPNIVGGTTTGGALDYSQPIVLTFLDPAHASAPGITDYVQILGDFIAIPGTATMTAFDANGALLGSVTDIDNDLGVNLTLAIAGIHSVTLTQTSATIGLDNLSFDTVVGLPAVAAAVPEPASSALLLAGLGVLGVVLTRHRD